MKDLLSINGKICPSCGRVHSFDIDSVISGAGALERLPEAIGRLGAKKPFILSDVNTFSAAGSTCNRETWEDPLEEGMVTHSSPTRQAWGLR